MQTQKRQLSSVNQSVSQSNLPPHFFLSRAAASTCQRPKVPPHPPPPPPSPPHPALGATPDHAYLKPVPSSAANPSTHPSLQVREADNHHPPSPTSPKNQPASRFWSSQPAAGPPEQKNPRKRCEELAKSAYLVVGSWTAHAISERSETFFISAVSCLCHHLVRSGRELARDSQETTRVT
ncbi:hypothetical protein LZ31DRAFT_552988 [Colletotrichum somersetense]|nr:hypothetical protein LZ31DRAFT_552988 [Colletotrichum somersetense]